MAKRPYINVLIPELEKLFDQNRDNGDFLITLLEELAHRRLPRSKALKKRVIQALSVAQPAPETESSPFRMTPEQHREAAADYRQRAEKWSGEQAEAALKLAQAHEALANQIERQLAKKS
jgi:hypothetical protein